MRRSDISLDTSFGFGAVDIVRLRPLSTVVVLEKADHVIETVDSLSTSSLPVALLIVRMSVVDQFAVLDDLLTLLCYAGLAWWVFTLLKSHGVREIVLSPNLLVSGAVGRFFMSERKQTPVSVALCGCLPCYIYRWFCRSRCLVAEGRRCGTCGR